MVNKFLSITIISDNISLEDVETITYRDLPQYKLIFFILF